MEVTTTIELNDEDQEERSRILDCSIDDISDSLSSYSSAALKEYVSMFLGQRSLAF